MRHWMPLAAIAVVCAVAWAHAAPTDPARAQACAQLKDLNQKEKTTMQSLQDQIKSARDQVQSLEEQRKVQGEQFRTQRDALIAQLDPAAASAMQSHEAQMKDLGAQEQQELKAVREKYQAQRQALKPPHPNLNCR